MSFRTENKRTGVSSPPLATTELRQSMRRLVDFLAGPLIKRYFFALLGGCRHTQMGWPIRLDGCAYRVCVGCGIKRLFDEDSFLSYGPYGHDVKRLLARRYLRRRSDSLMVWKGYHRDAVTEAIDISGVLLRLRLKRSIRS